ncbi:MAG: protein kinase [Planctomycetales bacterium]|nr:protein kinase [Planctomycetales bacterium]
MSPRRRLRRSPPRVEPRAFLTDFGLGAAAGVGETPAAGTAAYMAPERLRGGDADRRGDLWSLGIVLFEMLAGERPQPGDRPGAFVRGLPPRVDALFARLFTRASRRASATVAARELRAALAEVRGSARRAGRP